jgi:3-oxoacyl-[acyl-carrier-protein] synthase-1
MERAVHSAGIGFADLDYVNLHGTGTRANDLTEGQVCAKLLAPHTVASATKGWTGHTLGAAGIVESVLCLYALASGRVPGTLNTSHPEADFNLALQTETRNPRVALSNSFGFGGNNCAVVFAHEAAA